MKNNSYHDKSLSQIADHLIASTTELMRTARSEEDLRIGFEKLLAPILKELGIEITPRYERLGKEAASIYRGRPDAVHGLVIIEYESPHSFISQGVIDHAHDQLVGYISAEAAVTKETLFYGDPKYIGIGFDGEKIFFTKYQGDKSSSKTELDKKDFIYNGPYQFDVQSARTFLTYLRALARRPLSADHLAEVFGPKSKLAPLAVRAFADSLEHWGKERVKVFFNEWKRLFGIVYGEQFSGQKHEEAKALSELYGVGTETDFQELLFSVHTYFALLMKLIAAELVMLKETSFISSYSQQLVHTSKKELIAQLFDIENGGIYAKRGITNFLEGDFFRWYLDAWSPQLEDAIREIARGLSEFEPATTSINPDATRDLLKKLYQYLVPQEVRHKLGEYYTPDWLTQFLLEEVGYTGDASKRFLDPACGSGTFLVFAIQKAKEYGEKHGQPPLETAKKIIKNIWGFDLNPLAVIAARTNYLFALGDFGDELSNFEIPVYLADSVLWPERGGQQQLDFTGGDHIKVQTSVQQFHVPLIWVTDNGFLMSMAASLIEETINNNYSIDEAMNRFKGEGLVFPPHEDVVRTFYKEILDLEKQGKNGIWARFLKNAFAPMAANKFDYIVGNPPWIRWDYLSDEYRQATLPLWKHYGLFSLKGFQSRLGGGKKDFSMLFTYVCADYYLKPTGKLGFLITQEVFKTKGAGEGFRRFRLGQGDYLDVLKAHDMSLLQPFEGATNKTAAIILRRGAKTQYPVPYTVWFKKKGQRKISTDALWETARYFLQKRNQKAVPLASEVGAWQTYSPDQYWLPKLEGSNYYSAHSGAYISPYGVFWLEVNQVLSNNNLLVANLSEHGKTEILKIRETIESDLVYPALRGSDIRRWQAVPEIYVLLTQDPSKREPYPESEMKKNWPRTYTYLTQFKDVLKARASKVLRDLAEKTEFYAVFGVADYTLAKYRVVWKRMTNDMFACVISQIKTPFGYKIIVPLETTALIAAESEDEAHFLCAIINSVPLREFVKSFSSSGRGFGTSSVMEHVAIPKFDPQNTLHLKLAGLSKKLHELKSKGKENDLIELEKKNDELVRVLFKIHSNRI